MRGARAAALGLTLLLVACDPSEEPEDAASPSPDAGELDAGALDAGQDDAGELDAGEFDAGALDGGEAEDAAAPLDASEVDAFAEDAAASIDASTERQAILAGFCPSTVTPPGRYRGTLAGNLNDIAGACGRSAPGRDGALRVSLEPGQTLRAAYRHAGDGVLYLLGSCPVVASCVASADATSSGLETLEYTHTGTDTGRYYLVLDSDDLAGPQTFELDLEITP